MTDTDRELLERIVKVEEQNIHQSSHIEEILKEVKCISTFLYGVKPKIDALTDADLDIRITKIETKNRVAAWMIGVIVPIGTFFMIMKDKLFP